VRPIKVVFSQRKREVGTASKKERSIYPKPKLGMEHYSGVRKITADLSKPEEFVLTRLTKEARVGGGPRAIVRREVPVRARSLSFERIRGNISYDGKMLIIDVEPFWETTCTLQEGALKCEPQIVYPI
jgi:hypothetical protein